MEPSSYHWGYDMVKVAMHECCIYTNNMQHECRSRSVVCRIDTVWVSEVHSCVGNPNVDDDISDDLHRYNLMRIIMTL